MNTGEANAVADLLERSGLKQDADSVRDLSWRRLMAQAEQIEKIMQDHGPAGIKEIYGR